MAKARSSKIKASPGVTMGVLRRSSKAASKHLLSKKNVAFITIGDKRTKGMRTGTAAVIVYVLSKEDVPIEDRIPPTIPALRGKDNSAPDSILTDVVKIHSRPKTFGARSGDILISSDGKQGVCGFPFSKNNIGYLLTNAHVGCDMARGGAPTIISIIDPITKQLVEVGPVIWSSGLSPLQTATDDSAVARADYVSVDPAMITNLTTPIVAEGFISQGNSNYWYIINGTRFVCGNPEPIAAPANIDVDGIEISYQNFWVMQMLEGIVGPGHSGSLLCQDGPNGPIACGLVFGGCAPSQIFAFSFKPIFDRAFSSIN